MEVPMMSGGRTGMSILGGFFLPSLLLLSLSLFVLVFPLFALLLCSPDYLPVYNSNMYLHDGRAEGGKQNEAFRVGKAWSLHLMILHSTAHHCQTTNAPDRPPAMYPSWNPNPKQHR